jgi:AcrR family transcriptional regulator
MAATAERRYHHGNLRAALLDAAEAALARGEALSLRELAREIGVSHAAPRRHFADRQALLDALAERGFARLGAAMDAAAGADRPWADRVRALAGGYVRFATEHAALLDVMYAGKHRPGAVALREAAERAFAAPLALIAEGQAAGDVAPGDPARLGTVLWASIHGVASMANAGLLGEQPADGLLDEAVARVLAGLRP